MQLLGSQNDMATIRLASAFKRNISLEYLLLPPRSALKVVPPMVTHWLLHLGPSRNPPTRQFYLLTKKSGCFPNSLCTDGRVSVMCLSAIHFRGRFIRQVSCYTLLSGCRLPWPPSCCLDESTPFVGSPEHIFRHLNSCVWFIPHRHSCLPGLAH